MVNITLDDIIKHEEDVMSPETPGFVEKQAGGSTPVKAGDLVKFKGDKDGHVFRLMRTLGKYANVVCVEHTSVSLLEKIEE